MLFSSPACSITCVRSLDRPGLTGVRAWPKSHGQPGHRPCFDRVGQGIKNRGSRGYPGQPQKCAAALNGRAKITGKAVTSPVHTKSEKWSVCWPCLPYVQCVAMVTSLGITSFLRSQHVAHVILTYQQHVILCKIIQNCHPAIY